MTDTPATTGFVVFENCRFYQSVTMELRDWADVVAVLRSAGRGDLADRIERTGRPE